MSISCFADKRTTTLKNQKQNNKIMEHVITSLVNIHPPTSKFLVLPPLILYQLPPNSTIFLFISNIPPVHHSLCIIFSSLKWHEATSSYIQCVHRQVTFIHFAHCSLQQQDKKKKHQPACQHQYLSCCRIQVERQGK